MPAVQHVNTPPGPVPKRSRFQRFIRFPLTLMIIAIFMTALAGGLTLTYASQLALPAKDAMWPELLAAVAVLLAYWLYVRLLERRPAAELAPRRAVPELLAGLLSGAALVTVVVGLLMAARGYHILGSNGLSAAVITPLGLMTFVGVLEEVLTRGIIFRIIEQWLGSWMALAISSLLFGLAHLPGEGAGLLVIFIALIAGVVFAATFMLTRRLWLGIGMHVAWNYTLGSIYSIAVSGREAEGLLKATVSGPDWLTGGQYGLEASVFTLVVLTAAGIYLLRSAAAKGHVVAPRWRR
jgi:membrane protease YdiL (CAAX protease family)